MSEGEGARIGATARAAVAGGVATAAVMAGISGWLFTQTQQSHQLATQILERQHEGEVEALKRSHEDILQVQERGKTEALALLRADLEARIDLKEAELAEARAETRRARAAAEAAQKATIDSLQTQLTELKSQFSLYHDADGRVVVFDFDRIYRPLRDRDISNRHAPLYDGQVYAIRRFEGAPPEAAVTMHRLLEGTVARFLTQEGAATEVGAYQPAPADGRGYETYWQLGPTVTLEEESGVYHRMAPHVSVRRYDPSEIGTEENNAFTAGKPELYLFLREFNDKMTYATVKKLPLQVRRLRQEGALYFAHFRTPLRDVKVDGVMQSRIFVHELLLTAPTREGVFVFKGAFTSDEPFYVTSPHWPQVMDWWANLRINPV